MRLLSRGIFRLLMGVAAALSLFGLTSLANDENRSPRIIYDSSEKNNYSEGEQTDIFKIDGLFRKTGFDPDGKDRFYFVQLSDIHIYAEDEARADAKNIFNNDLAADLQNVLNEINSMEPRPSFIVITGDMVHDAEVKQFERLKRLLERLSPEIPLYFVLGNHDANRNNFIQVFAGRQPYYSFDKGKWHFAVLDSRSDGSLENKQTEWLAEDIKNTRLGHIMFFTHIPMIFKEGWEDVRLMREKIFMLIRQYGKDAWIFSGHLHYNFLAQCKYDGMPAVNLVSTTSSTGSFGYEIPGYRIVCVDGDKIKSTVFKTAGTKTGFRIDPPCKKWPVYVPPPFEPPKKELISFEVPDDQKYIFKMEGVGLKDNYRFVDATGFLVYAIPMDFTEKDAVLRVDIGSDYIVEVSSDNNTYREIFRSSGRTIKKTLNSNIPEENMKGILYLKIRDRTPEDGSGAFIYGVRMYAGENP